MDLKTNTCRTTSPNVKVGTSLSEGPEEGGISSAWVGRPKISYTDFFPLGIKQLLVFENI